MNDKDLYQVLVDTISSNGFADLLAMSIAQSFGEKLRDDFGNEITKKLATHVEKISQEYIADYDVKQDIKWRVKQAFQGIDKAEIIKILESK